jgi:hypothetical protein
MKQLAEYGTFLDVGEDGKLPGYFRIIQFHMINYVKDDGRHISRLVAGGHLKDPFINCVYSGVVHHEVSGW